MRLWLLLQLKKQLKIMKKNEQVITKESNIAEIIYKYPEIIEVLLDYGLHCVGCAASSFDTLEAGAKAHGFTDKDIEEMVERANEVLNFKE